jgi:DNA-binding helix-hairpin-helix protein with protein kinase domain
MDDPFENVFEAHKRRRMSPHFEWTEALRIAIRVD